MILIDAIYINGGGGQILLEYLFDKLEETSLEIVYLIDKRIEKDFINKKTKNSIIFIDPNFLKRKNFYIKNINTFFSVLCFANLPPNIKINANVFTYFHQSLYLELPKEIKLKQKTIFWIKTKLLNQLKPNTNNWLVQSESVKNKLSKIYNIPIEKIKSLPFYPEIACQDKPKKNKNQFLYVSNGSAYKNHKNLIEAFCKFYDDHKVGELILTVSDNHHEVFELIKIKSKDYPIKNLGFRPREELINIYLESEFVIYPSFAESFGLGIIEGLECNCKILGADLTYLHQICKPSLIFNPDSVKEIYNAFFKATYTELPDSVSIIKNNIDNIIELLR